MNIIKVIYSLSQRQKVMENLLEQTNAMIEKVLLKKVLKIQLMKKE